MKRLTEEERQARVRQMEIDALSVGERRMQRHTVTGSSGSAEGTLAGEKGVRDGEAADSTNQNHGASFLKSMRSEVYSAEHATMGERLQQNKHYTQKGTDLDSSGFMKR